MKVRAVRSKGRFLCAAAMAVAPTATLMVEMHDGTKLATDYYLPEGEKSQASGVLYSKACSFTQSPASFLSAK